MKYPHFIFIFCILIFDFALAKAIYFAPNKFQLHMLNIGQGDSIFVQSAQGHHILIDGGPDAKVLSELGKIMHSSFKEIDLIILTHPHADHINGLISVLDRFKVNGVLMTMPDYDNLAYKQFILRLNQYRIPIYSAQKNQDIVLGNLQFDILYPFEPISGKKIENVNNASPIIKLNILQNKKVFSILFTGDAEKEVESILLENNINIHSDVLKAGHHGSKTSSTIKFLESVDPKITLISSGINNDYGHPSAEVLTSLQKMHVQYFRTDVHGRISLRITDSNELCVQFERQPYAIFRQIFHIRDPCN